MERVSYSSKEDEGAIDPSSSLRFTFRNKNLRDEKKREKNMKERNRH